MKRPRENSLSTCRENEIPLSPLEDLAGEGLCPLVATSPQEHDSRQRHCGRRKYFLPKNILFGACFVAVLAFGMTSLPAAHALSSTRNMAAANSASFEDVVIRRIEETNSDETSSSNAEECNVPVSECMQCSYSEQKAYEACKETGRWQKFKCVMPGYTGSQDDEYKHEMKSCKHTNFDNGLAMVSNSRRKKRRPRVRFLLLLCDMLKHFLIDCIYFVDRRNTQTTNWSFLPHDSTVSISNSLSADWSFVDYLGEKTQEGIYEHVWSKKATGGKRCQLGKQQTKKQYARCQWWGRWRRGYWIHANDKSTTRTGAAGGTHGSYLDYWKQSDSAKLSWEKCWCIISVFRKTPFRLHWVDVESTIGSLFCIFFVIRAARNAWA